MNLIKWLSLLIFTTPVYAASLTFEWNVPADSTVTGYRLYVGTNAAFTASNAVAVLSTSSTNVTWTNAIVGKDVWFFATSTNSCCESDPSNLIMVHVPPAPVLRVRMGFQFGIP